MKLFENRRRIRRRRQRIETWVWWNFVGSEQRSRPWERQVWFSDCRTLSWYYAQSGQDEPSSPADGGPRPRATVPVEAVPPRRSSIFSRAGLRRETSRRPTPSWLWSASRQRDRRTSRMSSGTRRWSTEDKTSPSYSVASSPLQPVNIRFRTSAFLQTMISKRTQYAMTNLSSTVSFGPEIVSKILCYSPVWSGPNISLILLSSIIFQRVDHHTFRRRRFVAFRSSATKHISITKDTVDHEAAKSVKRLRAYLPLYYSYRHDWQPRSVQRVKSSSLHLV